MRVIDSHVHLYPAEVDLDPAGWAQRHGERHWATLCTRRRRDGRPVQSLPTLPALLAAMDAAGVEKAVLLGWYWETPECCAWQNRFYAQCVRAHPDRLAACATIHPAAGPEQVRAELVRAHEEGLRGLGELSPHSQGYSASDPVLADALALAADYGWPVNLHVTDPDTRPFPGKIETPLEDFVGLAQRFPHTRFILAHWGGLLPLRKPLNRDTESPVPLGGPETPPPDLPNVYYDTAASPLLYDATIWQRFRAVVPDARVLYGSDYPLNLYPRVAVEAEMMRLIEEARAGGASERLLSGTAEELFFRAS